MVIDHAGTNMEVECLSCGKKQTVPIILFYHARKNYQCTACGAILHTAPVKRNPSIESLYTNGATTVSPAPVASKEFIAKLEQWSADEPPPVALDRLTNDELDVLATQLEQEPETSIRGSRDILIRLVIAYRLRRGQVLSQTEANDRIAKLIEEAEAYVGGDADKRIADRLFD